MKELQEPATESSWSGGSEQPPAKGEELAWPRSHERRTSTFSWTSHDSLSSCYSDSSKDDSQSNVLGSSTGTSEEEADHPLESLPDFSPCTSRLARSTEARKRRFVCNRSRPGVNDPCFSPASNPCSSPSTQFRAPAPYQTGEVPLGPPQRNTRLFSFHSGGVFGYVASLWQRWCTRGLSSVEANGEEAQKRFDGVLSCCHTPVSQAVHMPLAREGVMTPRGTRSPKIKKEGSGCPGRPPPRLTFVGCWPHESMGGSRAKEGRSRDVWENPFMILKKTWLAPLRLFPLVLSLLTALSLVVFSLVLEHSPLQAQHLV